VTDLAEQIAAGLNHDRFGVALDVIDRGSPQGMEDDVFHSSLAPALSAPARQKRSGMSFVSTHSNTCAKLAPLPTVPVLVQR
jgi:hypothetical protein